MVEVKPGCVCGNPLSDGHGIIVKLVPHPNDPCCPFIEIVKLTDPKIPVGIIQETWLEFTKIPVEFIPLKLQVIAPLKNSIPFTVMVSPGAPEDGEEDSEHGRAREHNPLL